MQQVISMSREKQDFINCIVYAFKAPLIYATDWGFSNPKEVVQEAKLFRMAELGKIWKTKQCTNYEAMLYLSSITMVTPVTHETYKLFVHCFLQYKDISMITEVPEQQKWFKRDAELFDNEKESLAFLKKKIFSRQVSTMNNEDVN